MEGEKKKNKGREGNKRGLLLRNGEKREGKGK